MLPSARCCLMLYKVTGKEKYRKAAQSFRSQLVTQPRIKEGDFWRKKRYPHQMWLDGLYMADLFFAEYSLIFNELQNFDEITKSWF